MFLYGMICAGQGKPKTIPLVGPYIQKILSILWELFELLEQTVQLLLLDLFIIPLKLKSIKFKSVALLLNFFLKST